MKSKEIFEGTWFALTHELRNYDEWELIAVYEPDEWTLGFRPEGLYSELYCPGELRNGTWSVENGVISIDYDNSGTVEKCVFREEARGTYLYFYDDFYRFSSDPAVIVKLYAHTRRRIVRMNNEKS